MNSKPNNKQRDRFSKFSHASACDTRGRGRSQHFRGIGNRSRPSNDQNSGENRQDFGIDGHRQRVVDIQGRQTPQINQSLTKNDVSKLLKTQYLKADFLKSQPAGNASKNSDNRFRDNLENVNKNQEQSNPKTGNALPFYREDRREQTNPKIKNAPPLYRKNQEKVKINYVVADRDRTSQDNVEKRKRIINVGFKYLKELSEKKPTEIMCEILDSKSPFIAFLEKRDLQPDWLFLVVQIIAKMCSCEFIPSRNKMLNQICRSEFLHAVSYYLGEVSFEKQKSTIKNLPIFVDDLLIFYSSVIDSSPSLAVDKNFAKLIGKAKKAVDSMSVDLNLEIDETVFSKLDALKGKIEDHENTLKGPPKNLSGKNRLHDLARQPPPDHFRDLCLYPTYEDLTRRSLGFVRPNVIEGAYDNVEHYLDVQFRLLREDFVDPLRRGLNEYWDRKLTPSSGTARIKSKNKINALRLYPKCIFQDARRIENDQLVFLLNFDRDKKMRIKWEYSKRFMHGSLLLFTNDGFRSFFCGTVAHRDIKHLYSGQILVSFPNDSQTDKNFLSKEFLMAESEVFFEPYFLVMKILKTLNESNFPMKRYIVEGESKTDYPKYMSDEILWTVDNFDVNPLEIEEWPSPKLLGLDEYQYQAFTKALTSDFCVIQGPPGSGKTFIGLKIVEALLQNIQLNGHRIRAPLLIVCFTNHALDQFLEGILKYTQKIIRVGGQSKSEKLKEFNLRGSKQNKIRQSKEARDQIAPAFSAVRKSVKKYLNAISRLTEEKKRLEKPTGILKYDFFRNIMTEDQRNFLPNSKRFLDWLFEFDDKTGPFPILSKNNGCKRLLTDIGGQGEPKLSRNVFVEDGEEEDDHLVDEDNLFEMDSTSDESLISQSPYELTIEEMEAQYDKLFEHLEWLQKIREVPNMVKHRSDMKVTEMAVRSLVHKLQVLKDQSTRTNPSFESTRRVLAKDIRHLTVPERWVLYWSWIRSLRDEVIKELLETEYKYRESLAEYEDVQQMEDLYLVERADVVGMTTTCAARLHWLLNSLKPAIVIVEEAAEVLESHIVTSLTKSCQQVILIGDHKQLKPSAAVYQLSRYYNIDISLFERMINNGMDCPMLRVQHRMRPEISSLITPLIYPTLENAKSVHSFEDIKGVTKNLFFLSHNEYEQNVEETSTRQNAFEADFIIELCGYLILQGYDPRKITILTTYNGQMFSLREKKHERQLTQNVKCVVVDKYQGEENDIILLSLVRSNAEAKIGFLKNENRVCVALSRARKGFYIVGNMNNLASSSPELWGTIEANLRNQNAIGDKMQLYCPRHKTFTEVSCASDFDKVREGGCLKYCSEFLKCGHKCKSLCHTLNREHEGLKCREPCDRICARGKHKCPKLCLEDCDECTVVQNFKLHCGHEKSLPCHMDESEYMCVEVVDDISPLCKHPITRKCYENPEDVTCFSPCEDRLECGHSCPQKCHKKSDPDHLEFECKKPCERMNKMCLRGHKCEKLCFEECSKCSDRVILTLRCGHLEKLPCSTEIEKVDCFKQCERICDNCQNKCLKKCSENCSPCQNKVLKPIVDCGHSVRIKCHEIAERKHCTKACERLLSCGHKCANMCREECGTTPCRELVKDSGIRGLCGHDFVNIPCSQRNAPYDEEILRNQLSFCDAPCNELLKCEDACGSTCGKCWQGRFHEPCQMNCGSVMICGHSCKYPCRQMCPPCEEPCGYRCRHSKCPKKCGVPCISCKEPCEWNCPHAMCTKKCSEMCDRQPCYEVCTKILKCGHPCIGFCGEPCPSECRECNKEITEIMFGYEDEEGARFVHLEDCKHTIESQALDQYFNTASPGGEIVMKVCPLCKTPITRTLRYMNHVKRTYLDVLKVKSKVFGSEKTLTSRKKELYNNIVHFVKSSAQNVKTTGLHRIHKMADEYRHKVTVVKNKKNTISNAELNTIEFFYKVLVDINSRLESLRVEDTKQKTKQLCTDITTQNIVKYVKALLARIHDPALQISQQLMEDIAVELRRYHKMVDYSSMLHNPSYLSRRSNDAVENLRERLQNHIFGLERFDSVEDAVNATFEEMQEVLKTVLPIVTDEEKRMINAAMSTSFRGGISSKGHWYTCSKGHYYVITECGGAMEKSNCPECGEEIGGEHHRTVKTAILASDVDGAKRPAWGAQNEMGNYQF